MKTILLSVDNNEPVTYDQFYTDNTAPDVDQPTVEDFETVKNLKVNESTYIGICEVKRIK
jgi:hypothetical protein